MTSMEPKIKPEENIDNTLTASVNKLPFLDQTNELANEKQQVLLIFGEDVVFQVTKPGNSAIKYSKAESENGEREEFGKSLNAISDKSQLSEKKAKNSVDPAVSTSNMENQVKEATKLNSAQTTSDKLSSNHFKQNLQDGTGSKEQLSEDSEAPSSKTSQYVEMSIVTVHPPQKKQQKKRIPGSFVCDFEGCLKSFTRQEHLSRHKLNHNPTVIYKCKYPDCKSTFVRSDLQDRHHKRHENRILKEKKLKLLELKSQRNSLYNRMDTLNFNLKPSSNSSSLVCSLASTSNTISKCKSADDMTDIIFNSKAERIAESKVVATNQALDIETKALMNFGDNSDTFVKSNDSVVVTESESPELSVAKVFDNGASMTILDLSEKFISDPNMNISSLDFKDCKTTHNNSNSVGNKPSIKKSQSMINTHAESSLNIVTSTSSSSSPSINTTNNDTQENICETDIKALTQEALSAAADPIKRAGSLFENKPVIKLQKNNSFIHMRRPVQYQEQRSNSYQDQKSPAFQDSNIILPLLKNNSFHLENTEHSNTLPEDNKIPDIVTSNFPLSVTLSDSKLVPKKVRDTMGKLRNFNQGQFDMSIQHLISNVSSPRDNLINDFSESSSPLEISAWIESNFMPKSFQLNNNQQYSNDLLHFGLHFNMSELFQYMTPFLDSGSDSQEFLISLKMIKKITTAIPALANNIDLNVTSCQRCLQIYWKLFHVQFPFLHKPSFVAEQAPELLIISMIMLGAGLVSSTGCDESEYITNSRNLADSICIPLRWKLFEINDYSQPAETWMVQSLLILEYYEKFFTSRNLHERNHAHHGAIIQLLRKSSTLGAGSDTTISYNSNNNDDENIDEDRKRIIWQKWIDFECLKRATLMAFYIDSTHSIIFGHFGILYSHQIQIEMPCDDELWESTGSNFKITMLKKPRLFLQELRSLLKSQPVRTGVFGKRILMSGLLAIIFQLQQRDLQTSALGWDKDKRDSSWKEYLSYILDYLAHDTMKGCCDTESAVLLKHDNEPAFEPSGKNSLKSYFSNNDTRCKYPAYHIAHIIMRISHHDLVIFSGDNMWLNKTATLSDYYTAKKKIEQWANSTLGRLSVIHAFLYLFEMFLTPQNFNYDVTNPNFKNYKYECLNDPIVERSYAIYIATLAVWAYCFTVEGLESSILTNNENIDINMYSGIEDGYSFLRRIRNELSRHTRLMLHTIPASDASDFHKMTLFQANFLPFIPNKKNVTGLLAVVSLSLSKSNWQLAREFSLLFRHCVRRSLGSQVVYCNLANNSNR